MAIDKFVNRHIGPRDKDISEMLAVIGVSSLEELIDQTVPSNIRLGNRLICPMFDRARILSQDPSSCSKNKVFNTYIGMGWYDTITPAVICAIFLRTLHGTPLIRLIRQRFHREG